MRLTIDAPNTFICVVVVVHSDRGNELIVHQKSTPGLETTMRAIQITEHVAGPEGLVIHTLPDLLPTVNHYVVAVHAVAANFFDLLQIAGKYQHQPPLPFISGSEFSGVIAALPTGKSSPAKFSVGDHVFGAFQGAYATQIQGIYSLYSPLLDSEKN